MTKRKTNIKQHFVPQFYLRNFVDNKGKFVVYDVNREKSYTTSPSKESYEKYFYDINPKILKIFSTSTINYEEIIDDKIRILNEEVSAISITLLKNFLSSEKDFKFERNEREKLYDFIVLQMIRTPFYRERLSYLGVSFSLKSGINDLENDDEYISIIHNLLVYGVIERLYGLNFNLNEKYYSIFEHLIDEIFNIKIQLQKAGKLFLINKSSDNFICSNNPVNVLWKPDFFAQHKALVTFMDNKKIFDIGNYIEFHTVFFPISSDFSIFMFDKSYSKELTNMNQGIGIIRKYNSDLILNLNYSTFLKSYDKVYRKEGSFNEFIEMKNKRKNPELKFEFNE